MKDMVAVKQEVDSRNMGSRHVERTKLERSDAVKG